MVRNMAIYRRPDTSDAMDPAGYFQAEIVTEMHDEEEVSAWRHSPNTMAKCQNIRTVALCATAFLPGPTSTISDRRVDGAEPLPINRVKRFVGILTPS